MYVKFALKELDFFFEVQGVGLKKKSIKVILFCIKYGSKRFFFRGCGRAAA
jgi:hypothetical protein